MGSCSVRCRLSSGSPKQEAMNWWTLCKPFSNKRYRGTMLPMWLHTQSHSRSQPGLSSLQPRNQMEEQDLCTDCEGMRARGLLCSGSLLGGASGFFCITVPWINSLKNQDVWALRSWDWEVWEGWGQTSRKRKLSLTGGEWRVQRVKRSNHRLPEDAHYWGVLIPAVEVLPTPEWEFP